MKDINLLQSFQSEEKSQDTGLYGRRCALVCVCAAVVLAGAFVSLKLTGRNFKEQAQSFSEEAKSYSAVTEIKASIAEKDAEIKSLGDLIKAAGDTSPVGTGLLATIRSAFDEYIFLTNFSIDEAGAVNFTGKSANRTEIADLLYSLKQTELFSGVSVKIINTELQEESMPEDLYNFTMTAVLKGGVGNE